MSEVFDITKSLVILLLFLFIIGALFFRSLHRSDDPPKLVFKWLLTIIILGAGAKFIHHLPPTGWPPFAALVAIFIGAIWTHNWVTIFIKPLTNIFDGGDEEPELRPLYSMAEAKRKRGLHQEAVAEIRKQLEKFPGDHTGSLLLAGIQAEDLNDLPGAQLTIERLIQHPRQSPPIVASALNNLADWHMKFGQDPESARATLERIIELFPNTQLAQNAAQRIAHLSSMEHLLTSHERGRIEITSRERDLGLRASTKEISTPQIDPQILAEHYVKQLEEHPFDTEAREKLALLYAEHFQRLDLAVNQLEQLIAQPKEAPKRIARWLNLLASVQIQHGNNLAAAQEALQRITQMFPKTAIAESAVSRLAYLKMEMKKNETSQAIKLGSYEKNLGLKQA